MLVFSPTYSIWLLTIHTRSYWIQIKLNSNQVVGKHDFDLQYSPGYDSILLTSSHNEMIYFFNTRNFNTQKFQQVEHDRARAELNTPFLKPSPAPWFIITCNLISSSIKWIWKSQERYIIVLHYESKYLRYMFKLDCTQFPVSKSWNMQI